GEVGLTVIGAAKVPGTSPRPTLSSTFPERSMTSESLTPSPVTSASTGLDDTAAEDCWSGAVKVPPAAPKRTVRFWLPPLAVAKSKMPSWLKSAATIADGPEAGCGTLVILYRICGAKPPPASFKRTDTSDELRLATAKSPKWSPLKSPATSDD